MPRTRAPEHSIVLTPATGHDAEVLFCDPPGLPSLDIQVLGRRQADAHRLLLGPDGTVLGRCSLWWNRPSRDGCERLGLIGHYAAHTIAAGRAMLRLGCDELAARGCTVAVGPIDGTTWRHYRLVTDGREVPPFFLEPENPAEWPEHFSGAGFGLLLTSVSALDGDLSLQHPRASDMAARSADAGVSIRSADLTRLDEELRRCYGIAVAAFGRNALSWPIDEGEFVAQHIPLRTYLRPELVLLAERAGRAIGFLFAVPDVLESLRGEPVRTVILKSLAVTPAYAGIGAGGYLVERAYQVARELGYTRAIHALMRDPSWSLRRSAEYGARPIRRYALFARHLRP